MKDGVLMRKYYGEDGTVTHHQIIIPKHIVPEPLSTLRGKRGKHPGIDEPSTTSRTSAENESLGNELPRLYR